MTCYAEKNGVDEHIYVLGYCSGHYSCVVLALTRTSAEKMKIKRALGSLLYQIQKQVSHH